MANILVHLGHPAHVHFYRHAIQKLEEQGHTIFNTAVDKEYTRHLLDEYDLPYQVVGKHKKGLASKIASMLRYDAAFIKIIRKERIDVATGIGSPSIAQAGFITNTPSIIFTDTETATIGNRFMAPFATKIIVPECYAGDFGVKQLRYAGYHELAYLHPNYFMPDDSCLVENGLGVGEGFSVVRIVSRVSLHDRGDVGLGGNVSEVVERLSKHGRVLLSSEEDLPSKFDDCLVKSPGKIHSLLYYARIYLGESPTMASEAAILGTPSIYAQKSFRGYTDELSSKYDLIITFQDPESLVEKSLSRAEEILSHKDSKADWMGKRDRMLADKIDVTEFIVETLLSCVNK